MDKDEALRLALQALIEVRDANIHGLTLTQDYHEAITAIKAALEEKNEPVAWAMLHDNGHFIDAIHPNEHARVEGEYITPLYTTPPQRKPLTDETRNWIVATCPTPRHIIDAVERMHGIKGEA
jgi:hypothetical protein